MPAFASSSRAIEGRTRWKGAVAKTSVVPHDHVRLWDGLDYRMDENYCLFSPLHKKFIIRLVVSLYTDLQKKEPNF